MCEKLVFVKTGPRLRKLSEAEQQALDTEIKQWRADFRKLIREMEVYPLTNRERNQL